MAIWHEEHGGSMGDMVKSLSQLNKAEVFVALAYYWEYSEELEVKEDTGEAKDREIKFGLMEMLTFRSLG